MRIESWDGTMFQHFRVEVLDAYIGSSFKLMQETPQAARNLPAMIKGWLQSVARN